MNQAVHPFLFGGFMLTKIRIERLQRGLRQTDVVEMVSGVVQQYRLSLIERGIVPNPDEAKALAEAFGTKPEELFPESLS
jgi:transcriptional regulator with XRE-family HTH domain